MTTFSVDIGATIDLTVEDIWPDGDAPENPTPEDVIKAMKSSCRSVENLVFDWDLGPLGVVVSSRSQGSASW